MKITKNSLPTHLKMPQKNFFLMKTENLIFFYRKWFSQRNFDVSTLRNNFPVNFQL